MKILSRWTTSHECEACDKRFCGVMAALIELDDGRDRIVCADCAKDLPRAQEQILAKHRSKEWKNSDCEQQGGKTMWERNKLRAENNVDHTGNPTGGSVKGTGVEIHWQDDPLGRPPATSNGAFVDDVIESARQRLEFYQRASDGKFACRENAIAITKLEEALHWLFARRTERETRGVQGLHKP